MAVLMISIYTLESSPCADHLGKVFLSALPGYQKFLLTMHDLDSFQYVHNHQAKEMDYRKNLTYKKFQDIKEPALIDAVQKLYNTTSDADLKKAAETYLTQMQ